MKALCSTTPLGSHLFHHLANKALIQGNRPRLVEKFRANNEESEDSNWLGIKDDGVCYCLLLLPVDAFFLSKARQNVAYRVAFLVSSLLCNFARMAQLSQI